MTDLQKLNELYRQLDTCKSEKKQRDLTKAINRLEKKIKTEKAGMRKKDGIYYQ